MFWESQFRTSLFRMRVCLQLYGNVKLPWYENDWNKSVCLLCSTYMKELILLIIAIIINHVTTGLLTQELYLWQGTLILGGLICLKVVILVWAWRGLRSKHGARQIYSGVKVCVRQFYSGVNLAWSTFCMCTRELLHIYLGHKTNDWVRSKINFLEDPQEPLPATVKETETRMVWAYHTPRQPLQNHPSWHLGRVGDAMVGRGNAEWTTAKNGHPCQCQNCSRGPPADKTGRRSLLKRPSRPPGDPIG